MASLFFSVFCVLFVSSKLSVDAQTYENPVVPNANHPDPGLTPIPYKGRFYVATTSGDCTDCFPIMSSADLVNWENEGYVFPQGHLPAWGVSDYWAPEIHQINETQFNVYFVARTSTGILSVGVAHAPSPVGPFVDIGEPLFTQPEMGNIDPTYYFDSSTNQSYLIWKRDGNAVAQPTPIFLASLSPSGLAITSPPLQLITNDLPFEGPLVEAPWLIAHNNTFYLFYSAQGFSSPLYCISVARSENISGPYEKIGSPIMSTLSGTPWAGPGHCSVVGPSSLSPFSNYYMVYHAWPAAQIGTGSRVLMLDEMVFDEATQWPYLNGTSLGHPSYTPRPYPS